jgi:WD40 repeat protein
MRLEGHSQAIYSLAFSPVAPLLASGDYDGMIRLWDTRTGAPFAVLQRPVEGTYGIGAIAFSPDGSLLATGPMDKYSTLQLWKVETLSEIASFEAEDVESLAWNPDGSLLACGGNQVTIRNGKTGEIIAELKGHTDWVLSVAWSQDGRLLASGTAFDEAQIRVWDVQNDSVYAHLDEFQGYNIEEIRFCNDRELLYSTGFGTLFQWDTRTEPLLFFQAQGTHHYPTAISHDGKLIAFGDALFRVEEEEIADSLLSDADSDNSSSNIHIVDVATRNEIWTMIHFTRRDADISAIAFSPDGRMLATADTEGGLHLWNLNLL